MYSNIKSLLFILCFATLNIVCGKEIFADNKTQFTSIKEVPQSSWEKLAKRKIFFGHKSVGNNIVDGIKDLMEENPQIDLNIVKTADHADFNIGIFSHSLVGKNRDPISKNVAFANIMEKGIGDKADVAFFKYCYVDIIARTDIDKTFQDYKNTMALMKRMYPKTTFIHVTTPLRALRPPGIKGWAKTWIKRISDKSAGVHEDNIKRNKFNENLRQEYNERDPIFDLAKIESTFLDGKRCIFRKNGKTYYTMVPEYTDDGGHLNKVGRRITAEQLLIFLVTLPE